MRKLKNLSKLMLSMFILTLMICLPYVQTFAMFNEDESKGATGYWKLEAADYGKDLNKSNVKYTSSHNKATLYNSEKTHITVFPTVKSFDWNKTHYIFFSKILIISQ